jgi:hypothetical protein
MKNNPEEEKLKNAVIQFIEFESYNSLPFVINTTPPYIKVPIKQISGVLPYKLSLEFEKAYKATIIIIKLYIRL